MGVVSLTEAETLLLIDAIFAYREYQYKRHSEKEIDNVSLKLQASSKTMMSIRNRYNKR